MFEENPENENATETNMLLEGILNVIDKDEVTPVLEHILMKLDEIGNKKEVQEVRLVGAEIDKIRGEKGKDGKNGTNGEKGKQGDKGERGQEGKQGITGKQGEEGDKGKQGEKGERGEKGDTGATGKEGVKGKEGKDGSSDTPKQVKEKLLKQGISLYEISDVPDFHKIARLYNQSSKSVSLTELLDVNVSGVTNGQVLKYNTAKGVWEAGEGGGGGGVGPGTINELAYFDTANTVASLAVATYPSLTELTYVKGVTSAIQTQIDAKFTLPALTSGSILFSNGSTIAQDNANLFWDDTNNRLGIGTATPSARLHLVSGTEQFRYGFSDAVYTSQAIGSTGIVTYDIVGGSANRFTFNKQIRGTSGEWITGSFYALGGQGFNDMSMTGFYDRNELMNSAFNGLITITVTGAGVASTNTVVLNTLVNGSADFSSSLVTGITAATTQIEIVIDTGSTQSNYSAASWQPFLQTRLAPTSINSSATYARGVDVFLSLDGTNWFQPSAGQWTTTEFSTSSQIPSLWMGGNATPNSPSVLTSWRYARFVLTNFSFDPSYGSNGNLWIPQLGIRHYSAPMAKQFLTQVGNDIKYGTLELRSSTTPQLRFGVDVNNRLSATVSATGITTFALAGTNPYFRFAGDGGTLPSVSANTIAMFSRTSATASVSQISIIAGTQGSSIVNFGDFGNETVGQITYDHISDRFDFSAGSVIRARLNSTGLGVGTSTTVSAKLHVIDTAGTAVRIGFDTNNYLTINSSSTGYTTFGSVGSTPALQGFLFQSGATTLESAIIRSLNGASPIIKAENQATLDTDGQTFEIEGSLGNGTGINGNIKVFTPDRTIATIATNMETGDLSTNTGAITLGGNTITGS